MDDGTARHVPTDAHGRGRPERHPRRQRPLGRGGALGAAARGRVQRACEPQRDAAELLRRQGEGLRLRQQGRRPQRPDVPLAREGRGRARGPHHARALQRARRLRPHGPRRHPRAQQRRGRLQPPPRAQAALRLHGRDGHAQCGGKRRGALPLRRDVHRHPLARRQGRRRGRRPRHRAAGVRAVGGEAHGSDHREPAPPRKRRGTAAGRRGGVGGFRRPHARARAEPVRVLPRRHGHHEPVRSHARHALRAHPHRRRDPLHVAHADLGRLLLGAQARNAQPAARAVRGRRRRQAQVPDGPRARHRGGRERRFAHDRPAVQRQQPAALRGRAEGARRAVQRRHGRAAQQPRHRAGQPVQRRGHPGGARGHLPRRRARYRAGRPHARARGPRRARGAGQRHHRRAGRGRAGREGQVREADAVQRRRPRRLGDQGRERAPGLRPDRRGGAHGRHRRRRP